MYGRLRFKGIVSDRGSLFALASNVGVPLLGRVPLIETLGYLHPANQINDE